MLISNSFLALAAVVPASTTALETITAMDLAAGVDGDGAGPLAIAAAVARQPTAYIARDSVPSPHKNADLGALTLKQRQAQTSGCPDSCPPGFFGYCGGNPIGSETCGDACCVGVYACLLFTGCVKGDGSCSGSKACYLATASYIETSCIGDKPCYYGEFGGALKNSCKGHRACYRVSSYAVEKVGSITNSCNGGYACKGLANGGFTELILQSCNGDRACFELAGYGNVGPITKSCNRDNACDNLAYEGDIASITKTCNNDVHKPCAIMPVEGAFGHMINRVHAETGEKHTRASIGSILGCMEACNNDAACNGIKWKEHTGRPCRFFGGDISENPCNGRNVCITAEQAF